MNTEGMMALYRVAERIKRPFKMVDWFKHKGKHAPHKQKGTALFDLHGCGTSACWLGSAACDKDFVKATDIRLIPFLHYSNDGDQYRPERKGSSGMRAAAEGLDITYKQALHLFGPDNSGRKEDLLRRWWDVVTGAEI